MSAVNQSLSLMIPRVFPKWIDEQKIIDVFHKQHIGRVYKVSIIRMPDSKQRSYPVYKAFVYFSAWYENEIAYNFQQRIYGPKAQARVVYDDPWYWVAFENTQRRLSNNDKRLIRLGYQAYLQEQVSAEQDQRIRQLEEYCSMNLAERPSVSRYDFAKSDVNQLLSRPAPILPNTALNWNKLSESFAMDTLGDELNLTETAINVAEAALADLSFNDIYEAESWQSAPWNQMELETAGLSVELDLAETAISVAESALKDDLEQAKEERRLKQEEKMDEDDDYYSDYYDETCEREEDYDY